MSDPEERLIDQLHQCAIEAADVANAVLREYFDADHVRTVGTKSTSTDLVTTADLASESALLGVLRRHRPNDSIMSEEAGEIRGTTNVEWIVDPLDGTTNFRYRRPHFGVSIAARLNGLSIVGVVSDVSSSEIFSGVLGRGAWCNGRPITPSTCTRLDHSLVGYDSSYSPALRRTQLSVLQTLLPTIRDIRRLGSPAIDLCHVADGRLDATYDLFAHPWDIAAGSVIATAAGACVVDFRGDATFGAPGCKDEDVLSRGVIVNGFLAANASLSPLLVTLLNGALQQAPVDPSFEWLVPNRG